VQIACIALAGTVGAMGTLGHRRAGALELFGAAGHLLVASAPLIVAAIAGVVVHALWMLLWASVLLALSRKHRGLRLSLEVAAVAAIAFAVSLVLPAVVVGPVATLAVGERALVHLVLGVSLYLGMRLAFRG
jgi:hypothetical protein